MDTLEQENRQLRGSFLDLRPQVQQLRDQVGQLSESFQLATQHDQQFHQVSNGGFGDAHGFMDMGTSGGGHAGAYDPHSHDMLSRQESYDNGMDNGDNEALRAAIRNNSIGADSISNHNNNNGVLASAVDTRELLISENERIRSEIETLTAGLASLELKQNMAIMTESMRMQEEVQSLRAVCHGLRMQMHYLLLEQQNSRGHHGPPPPGSPIVGSGNSGSGANSGGGKGVNNGGGPPAGAPGGRPLSSISMPRPRFAGNFFFFFRISPKHLLSSVTAGYHY